MSGTPFGSAALIAVGVVGFVLVVAFQFLIP